MAADVVRVIDCVGTFVDPPAERLPAVRSVPVPTRQHRPTDAGPLWPAVLGLLYIAGWAVLTLWIIGGGA